MWEPVPGLSFCCHLEGYTLESLDEGQHRGQISKLTSQYKLESEESGGKEAWEEAAVSSTQERRQG